MAANTERPVTPYRDACRGIDANIKPAVRLDPVTPLMAIASRGPVVKRDANGTFNGIHIPNNLILPDGERDIYFVLDYDTILEVLRDKFRIFVHIIHSCVYTQWQPREDKISPN